MKLDRLLSRIRSALQDYASEFEQRALAAEYTELCTLAAQRLEQIVPLIREGQDYPALQIAESPPPVLDLIRQLSFPEATQWRAFCRQRGLPVGQPFDEQHVNLVNQLYGKKISETHPLYRHYRQAIRTHKYDQALRVLQSIRRVNQDDANAHAEYQRLAQKLLSMRAEELAATLDRGDTPRLIALMESIEADDLRGHENLPVWPRAQKVRDAYQLKAAGERCAVIAAKLRQVRASGIWQDTLPLFAEWDMLRRQFPFSLSPDDERDTAQTREWAAAYLAVRDREEERQRLWREVSSRLDTLARAPDRRPANFIAKDLGELLGFAKAMDDLPPVAEEGAQPPPDLDQRLNQAIARLRRLLARHRNKQVAFAAAAAAAVLLVASVIFWQQMRRTRLKAQTALIMKQLDEGSASALAAALADFDAQNPGYSGSDEMNALIQQARDYVRQHQTARARFDQEFAEISRAAQGELPPPRVVDLLAKLDELNLAAKELAPDDLAQVRPAAQQLRAHLAQSLTTIQEQRTARLTEITDQAQALLQNKLTDTSTAEAVIPVAQEAGRILAQAEQVPPDAALSTPAEAAARARLEELAKKTAGLVADGQAALAARAELKAARSLIEYHAAIEALAVNSVVSDPDVAAARALTATLPDWNAAAQRILLPGEIETWDFLKTAKDTRLQPAANAQNEDVAFSRLVGNDLLANIRRAELMTYVDGQVAKRAPVFLAGPMAETINHTDRIEETRQNAKVINENGTTTDRRFIYLSVIGQKPKGERLENERLAPESNLIKRLNLAFDPRTGIIREPLLRVLDDVRAYPDVSTVFKAYLLQELFKIMQMRPYDWGLEFSPSAKADLAELTKITGGSLAPSDWIFPGEGSRMPEYLRLFFESTASHNYYAEAGRNLEKLLALQRTPVGFLGHVNLQSHPELLEAKPTGATLWGLDVRGRWQPLFDLRSGQAAPIPNAPVPAVLSPLIYAEIAKPPAT